MTNNEALESAQKYRIQWLIVLWLSKIISVDQMKRYPINRYLKDIVAIKSIISLVSRINLSRLR